MDKLKKSKEKVSTVPYMAIDYSFFDHSKTKALRLYFKATGPYVLLLMWRQMYLRNGGLNDSVEFELQSIAEDSGTDINTVKNIIQMCVDLELLKREKKTKLLYSEEALRRLKVRLGDSEFYREKGKEGAAKRWGANGEAITPLLKPANSPAIGTPIANKKVSKEVIPVRVFTSIASEVYPLTEIPTGVPERSALLGGLLSARGLMLAPENKIEDQTFQALEFVQEFCDSPLYDKAIKFVRDYEETKAKKYINEKGLDKFLIAVIGKFDKPNPNV